MLCCVVLCCVVLCLFCAVLCCVVLFCAMCCCWLGGVVAVERFCGGGVECGSKVALSAPLSGVSSTTFSSSFLRIFEPEARTDVVKRDGPAHAALPSPTLRDGRAHAALPSSTKRDGRAHAALPSPTFSFVTGDTTDASETLS